MLLAVDCEVVAEYTPAKAEEAEDDERIAEELDTVKDACRLACLFFLNFC